MEHFIQLITGGRIGHFASYQEAADRARELFGHAGWQVLSAVTDHAELGEYIATARKIAENTTANKVVQLKELRSRHPLDFKTAKMVMDIAWGLEASQ